MKNKLELISDRFLKNDMSDKCRKILNKAKLKQRSEMKLEDWERLNYSSDTWCEEILSQIKSTSIPVEDYDKLSENDFIEKYEKPNLPVIIRGVTNDWPAVNKWNFQVILI
jgi:hypothetical protein